MKQTHLVAVDELATFMNTGWPGSDWYLTEHAEYLWERTFVVGGANDLYRPVTRGALVDLSEYEARVCWQGVRADPTKGQGHWLSELFLQWRRKRHAAVVVAYVSPSRVQEIENLLEEAVCMVLTN